VIVIDAAHKRLPRPAGRRSDGARHQLCISDRRRRPQVRALPADLDAAAQKVHDEVLSQCDNLLLMRMNSEADLGHLRDAFSFVPDGLIQRATTFRQGESLVAGKFVPHPTYVRSASDSPRKAAPTYQPHG
jgi:hypothetical protein